MSILKSLCSPSSVALIGVSRNTDAGALNPLKILKDFGYRGKIYPVNPSAKDIIGYKCYKEILEIPEVPELAVIMVSRELVPGILRQCADKGVRTVVIISDGFAESDEKGKLLQKELEDIHKKTGIRILGPNSMGVVNYYDSFTTSFVKLSSERAPVAFLGQSGLFVQGFSALRLGKAIDIGNGCDIGFSELLSELLDDDEIKIIALHVEKLDDPSRFSEVIKEKGERKPIVVFKSGRSKKAEEAIMSHSGSIAGDYNIYKAFFSSLGLLVVESTLELEDSIYLLSKINVPEKRKVGIITPSGGAGIICLDAMEDSGFELAKLSTHTLDRIKSIFPLYYQPSNPMDIMSASFRHGYKKVYTEAVNAMIEDENVDITFCINGVPTLKTIGAIIKEKRPEKPIVSWIIGEYREEDVERLTDNIPIAVFPHPERAFKSLDMCIRHNEWNRLSKRSPEPIGIHPDNIGKVLRKVYKEKSGYLFSEAFEIIKTIGLPVPETIVINGPLHAEDVLRKIKPPVCIKLDVKGALHKEKAGLLRLGIMDARELSMAYNEILSRVKQQDVRAVIVQKMVSHGTELFIGVKRESAFGAVMMVGRGGTDVEIYRDIEMIMIPFNREQARYAFEKTRIAKTIKKEDVNRFLNIMLRVSNLCTNFPEIKELDLNPVILNQEGIWVVDTKTLI